MKFKQILLGILLIPLVTAFTYPTHYYYDPLKRENIKVNLSFIERFENITPSYLTNTEIEFTTRRSQFLGYTYCYSLNGRIEITMYRESWIDYDYYITKSILLHELFHAYQCRILYEYPHHNPSFYEINLSAKHK